MGGTVGGRSGDLRGVSEEPRVVAIGGGTGLSTVLRGLKHLTPNITAVVTVADDGGSSGRLRADLGVPPPGDIRDCLLALADDESLLSSLFSHRFASGELAGHSFGNLFLAALTEVMGDFDRAVKESSKVLKITGTVLPSTTADVILHALLSDGRHLAGESRIGRAPVSVSRVWLEPDDAPALPLALRRIAEADVVVLGPGSLYTSVMPNLLVRGVTEALAETRARIVYVANIMTQPGETASFTGPDHVDALVDHLGPGVLDAVLVNETPVPPHLVDLYVTWGAEPAAWPDPPDSRAPAAEPADTSDTVVAGAALDRAVDPDDAGEGPVETFRGAAVVRRHLLGVSDHVRHDPSTLAAEVLALVPRTAP